MWPCISKPTKSRTAQFYVRVKNRWNGSPFSIFRFSYFMKEQFFVFIIPKFGIIKQMGSGLFFCFCRTLFIGLTQVLCVSQIQSKSNSFTHSLLSTVITFERMMLLHWKLKLIMNRLFLMSVPNFSVIW